MFRGVTTIQEGENCCKIPLGKNYLYVVWEIKAGFNQWRPPCKIFAQALQIQKVESLGCDYLVRFFIPQQRGAAISMALCIFLPL